jgi:hypothetical protein
MIYMPLCAIWFGRCDVYVRRLPSSGHVLGAFPAEAEDLGGRWRSCRVPVEPFAQFTQGAVYCCDSTPRQEWSTLGTIKKQYATSSMLRSGGA